jgi:hypothetical protein
MAHLVFVGIPENFIQSESALASLNSVKDFEVKQHFLIDG